MCCKCYSPILTLKGNICGLEMTIGCLMIGTSLLRNGAAGHGESVHKAQTSDHFGPLPNGDGGAGVDVVLVSIGEADDGPRLHLSF